MAWSARCPRDRSTPSCAISTVCCADGPACDGRPRPRLRIACRNPLPGRHFPCQAASRDHWDADREATVTTVAGLLGQVRRHVPVVLAVRESALRSRIAHLPRATSQAQVAEDTKAVRTMGMAVIHYKFPQQLRDAFAPFSHSPVRTLWDETQASSCQGSG